MKKVVVMRVENVMVSMKNVEMWEKKNEGCMDYGKKREEYLKGSFVKLKLKSGLGEDLERLRFLRRRMEGMRLYVVSGYERSLVGRLLENLGIGVDGMFGSVGKVLDEYGVDKENVVVFGNEDDVRVCEELGIKGVEGLEDVWGGIGLRRS